MGSCGGEGGVVLLGKLSGYKMNLRNTLSLFFYGLVFSAGLFGGEGTGKDELEKQGDFLHSLFEKARVSVVVVDAPPPNTNPTWGASGSSESFHDESGSFSDAGSGIIVDGAGHVVTNHHVIENITGDFVRVKLHNGKVVLAKIEHSDPKTDIAILQLPEPFPPALPHGNSDGCRVGQYVAAIGAPYGLEYSMSLGIISGLHRKPVTSSAYEDFIQTDAAINPGNSGGPLLNLDGEWVGINTLVHGVDRGLGFAIPSNQALPIISALIAKGTVERPWLGIRAEIPKVLDGDKEGVEVAMVSRNSPAEGAGIRKGDVILSVGGAKVGSPAELQKRVWDFGGGGEVLDVSIKRGKKVFSKKIKPGKAPQFETP